MEWALPKLQMDSEQTAAFKVMLSNAVSQTWQLSDIWNSTPHWNSGRWTPHILKLLGVRNMGLMYNGRGEGVPKEIIFGFINFTRAFGCVKHNQMWIGLKSMGVPELLKKIRIKNKKPQLEWNREQQNGFKDGNEQLHSYCYLIYLINMQNI